MKSINLKMKKKKPSRVNQQNKELVLWKDSQNWQTFSKTDTGKKETQSADRSVRNGKETSLRRLQTLKGEYWTTAKIPAHTFNNLDKMDQVLKHYNYHNSNNMKELE